MADSVAAPGAWVAASYSGGHLFKLVPGKQAEVKGEWKEVRPPFGVAYEVKEDGGFEEIWRTEGWFAQEGYLSGDGRYFVRLGGWPRDYEGLTDLAVAFYDRGRLVKEYLIKDLIKNREALAQTASHYFWRAEVQTRPVGFTEKGFELVLADKTRYEFDFTTGGILNAGVDSGARSFWEVVNARDAVAEARGRVVFAASAIRRSYEERFVPSNLSAHSEGKISGVHFDGPEWRGDFEPRVPLARPCKVRAVFPLVEGDRIECFIPAAELEAALQAVVKLPLVKEWLETGEVTEVEFRITGDRLHWDTEKLQKLLWKEDERQKPGERDKAGKYDGKDPGPAGGLRSWIKVIVDKKGPGYEHLFVNVKTGKTVREKE